MAEQKKRGKPNKCRHFVSNYGACASCGCPEETHHVCSRFRHESVDDTQCAACGRHELDHRVCSRYKHEGGDSESADALPCDTCGRLEEDHTHHQCAFFTPSEEDAAFCASCEREEVAHEVCEFFSPGGTHCTNCGCSEHAHEVCVDYFVASVDRGRCDTCGRLKGEHVVCDCYQPGADLLCVNCGRHKQGHTSEAILETWPQNRVHTKKSDHPFHSFAPECPRTPVHYYVDGKDAFAAIADAIEGAEREIFITGWSIAPELYLRRDPANPARHVRLDSLLKRKAEAGVRVYILAWNETKLAFKFNNQYCKDKLESLHPNIKMLVHPGSHPTTTVHWTHHDKVVCVDRAHAFLGGLDLAFGRYDTAEHTISDPCHLHMTWPGKDFYNTTLSILSEVHHPFADALDRESVPRMPWHDVHVGIMSVAAEYVATTFIQKWNFALDDLDVVEKPFLLLQETDPAVLEDRLTQPLNLIMPKDATVTYTACQVLRSIGLWSGGVSTEASIGSAYLSLIAEAEHYIYIENQFFISSQINPGVTFGGPVNTISQALFVRLCRAIELRQRFRVLILVPICPEGNFLNDMVVRFTMCQQYRCVSHGPRSLFGALRERFPKTDLREYLVFCSLRKAEVLDRDGVCPQQGDLEPEPKLTKLQMMIVDDRYVIIGSANINDRSMQGDRDSEIAVIMRDESHRDSEMNGEPFKAGVFAHSLRVRLWTEHLGCQPDAVRDPILFTAQMNTSIFERIFPNIPSNKEQASTAMVPLSPLQTLKYGSSLNEALPGDHGVLHSCVRGHLVFYPTEFLEHGSFDISMLEWSPGFLQELAH